MSDGDASDHLAHNRTVWSSWAPDYVAPGRRGWARREAVWGIWSVPDSTLGVLPDVAGADVVELGCGTAYISAWLARAGARPVALDPTAAQLATARDLQREFGLRFPLLLATAEAVPPSASTSRSRNTARACGPTRRGGCPRPRGCSVLAAS
jgi:SAM-dependent methyltransferase